MRSCAPAGAALPSARTCPLRSRFVPLCPALRPPLPACLPRALGGGTHSRLKPLRMQGEAPGPRLAEMELDEKLSHCGGGGSRQSQQHRGPVLGRLWPPLCGHPAAGTPMACRHPHYGYLPLGCPHCRHPRCGHPATGTPLWRSPLGHPHCRNLHYRVFPLVAPTASISTVG